MKKIIFSLVTILAITCSVLCFRTLPTSAKAESTDTVVNDEGWFYDDEFVDVSDRDLILRLYAGQYGETYYYKENTSTGETTLMIKNPVFQALVENGVVKQSGLHLLSEKDVFDAKTKFYIRCKGVNNTITYKFATIEDEVINVKIRSVDGVTSIKIDGEDSFKILSTSLSTTTSTGARAGAFWVLQSAKPLKMLSLTSESVQGTTYGFAVMSSWEECGNVAPANRSLRDFEAGFIEKANTWVNNALNVNISGPVFGTLLIGFIVVLLVRRGRR